MSSIHQSSTESPGLPQPQPPPTVSNTTAEGIRPAGVRYSGVELTRGI